jgi:OmpA-OmpF porin, OOP family
MRKLFAALSVNLLFATVTAFSQNSDSLVYAEGRVINAETKELIAARITYQSLPYGNKVGVITNSQYSFPMFDGEKYAITVEAAGFAPAKYMLDPAEANNEKKVIKDIELSNGAADTSGGSRDAFEQPDL